MSDMEQKADLEVLARAGVEIGGVALYPLPRGLSRVWRLRLIDRVEALAPLADVQVLGADGGDVNVEGVLQLARGLACQFPDTLGELNALWVGLQGYPREGGVHVIDGAALCRLEAEAAAQLGAAWTDADDHDAFSQCVRWVFPFDRMARSIGTGLRLLGKPTTR